jgi:hypothetical protein
MLGRISEDVKHPLLILQGNPILSNNALGRISEDVKHPLLILQGNLKTLKVKCFFVFIFVCVKTN